MAYEQDEWQMIGGLWRKTSRKGADYLGGQITVASLTLTISGWPPRNPVSDNPPAYVVSAPAAQLEDLKEWLDEWRAARAEQHPF